jgi:hypothetical protein
MSKLNLNQLKSSEQLKTQLYTFIALCSQDFQYSLVPASMLASTCLFLVLKLTNKMSKIESEQALLEIHSIINESVDYECLIQCMDQIEELLKIELKLEFNFETKTRIQSNEIRALQAQSKNVFNEISSSTRCHKTTTFTSSSIEYSKVTYQENCKPNCSAFSS